MSEETFAGEPLDPYALPRLLAAKDAEIAALKGADYQAVHDQLRARLAEMQAGRDAAMEIARSCEEALEGVIAQRDAAQQDAKNTRALLDNIGPQLSWLTNQEAKALRGRIKTARTALEMSGGVK